MQETNCFRYDKNHEGKTWIIGDIVEKFLPNTRCWLNKKLGDLSETCGGANYIEVMVIELHQDLRMSIDRNEKYIITDYKVQHWLELEKFTHTSRWLTMRVTDPKSRQITWNLGQTEIANRVYETENFYKSYPPVVICITTQYAGSVITGFEEGIEYECCGESPKFYAVINMMNESIVVPKENFQVKETE